MFYFVGVSREVTLSTGDTRRQIDPERGAELRCTGRHGYERADGFDRPMLVGLVLSWAGREIPFTAAYGMSKSSAAGEQVFVDYIITQFGSSLFSTIEPAIFADDDDYDAAFLLAVEALLIFGENFDGPAMPAALVRVTVGSGEAGKTFDRTDFGYPADATVNFPREGVFNGLR